MPTPPDRMSRSRLRIPARLTVTLFFAGAASGCSGSPVADAGDVVADQSSVDGTVADGPVVDVPASDVASDANDVFFDATDDCQAQVGQEGYFECLSDPRADVQVTCNQVVCGASECAAGCVACPTRMFAPAGVTCVAPAGSDAGAACLAAGRVCTAADCPAGCDSCPDPIYCSPDPSTDAAPPSCDPMYVCDFSACPVGCSPLV